MTTTMPLQDATQPNPDEVDLVPYVTPDGRGYVLGGRRVRGFADDTSLVADARLRIAEMARVHAPDTLSQAQIALLRTSDHRPVPDELFAGVERDADMLALYQTGLVAQLTPEERDRVRNPSKHLGGATYPLTVSQLARLTEASERKVRYWQTNGWIPAYRVRGERRFMEGAAVRAMCFHAHAEQPEVAAMGLVVRGRSERLVSYVGDALVSLASRRAGPESADRVLRAITDIKSVLSEIADAGKAERALPTSKRRQKTSGARATGRAAMPGTSSSPRSRGAPASTRRESVRATTRARTAPESASGPSRAPSRSTRRG